MEICRKVRQEKYPNGLPTGKTVATTAGNMQAKCVIHTVGPIYSQCGQSCKELLASCYTNSLKLAKLLGCKTIAFPAISTGVYGYPKAEAFQIAYETVQNFLEENEMEVRFVFFSKENEKIATDAIFYKGNVL